MKPKTQDTKDKRTGNAMMPLWLFGGTTVFLLLVHQGSRMDILYPVLSLAIGYWLLRTRPSLYVVFTFLLFCITPLVRRIADFQSAYHDPSTVLAAPLLTSLLSGLEFTRTIRSLLIARSRVALPFVLGILGVLYGIIVGLSSSRPIELVKPGLEWLAPIVFGAYCMSHAKDYRLLTLLEKITLIAALATGVYGLIQFVNPFPWDTFWLQCFNSSHFQPSFGSPERFQIRLFSTLNAPQIFAALLTYSIPLALTLKSKIWAFACAPVLLLALALTQSRTGLFTTAVGVMFLLFWFKGKFLARVGVLAAVLVVTLSAGMLSPEVVNKLSDRFDTFHDLRSDASATSRSLGMRVAVEMIAEEPFGQGAGFPDGEAFYRSDFVTRYGVDSHDLGLLEVGLSFGYLGGLLFLCAIAVSFYEVAKRTLHGPPAGAGLALAALASASSMLTVNPFQGLPGTWLWATLGCLMAGCAQETSLGWSTFRSSDKRPTLGFGRSAASAIPVGSYE